METFRVPVILLDEMKKALEELKAVIKHEDDLAMAKHEYKKISTRFIKRLKKSAASLKEGKELTEAYNDARHPEEAGRVPEDAFDEGHIFGYEQGYAKAAADFLKEINEDD